MRKEATRQEDIRGNVRSVILMTPEEIERLGYASYSDMLPQNDDSEWHPQKRLWAKLPFGRPNSRLRRRR